MGRKKKEVRKKTEDQLLKELGFPQADISDSPRATNGILFIPVVGVDVLPKICTVVDAKSDKEASIEFKRYWKTPEVVYRYLHSYYAGMPKAAQCVDVHTIKKVPTVRFIEKVAPKIRKFF